MVGGTPRAAIVTVGDELLLGRTVDTNAAWLGGALAALGIPVVRRYTTADEAGEIRRAVDDAIATAELVLITGGLGPTPDDLTRDAVAEHFGRPLREDPEVLERIRVRFRERGMDELPAPNRRVALVPEGARTLDNPHGTAPGLVLEEGGRLAVLLPGVPRELRGIVEPGLLDLLRLEFADRLEPVHTRTVHTTGIPESLLSAQVSEHLPAETGPVRLAFLPDVRGVDLRLTVQGGSAVEAEAWFDRLEEALAAVLGPWRFEAAGGDLVEAVSGALRARGATLAVAESCTGGLVAKRLTDLAGSSEVFVGGIIAYANHVKQEVLGVEAALLEEEGAVSEAVARGMAEGAASRLGARAGIGITGVAGPGGGTEEKPAGTVWYSACVDERTEARLERFPGDRESVRERAAQAALALLLHMLR